MPTGKHRRPPPLPPLVPARGRRAPEPEPVTAFIGTLAPRDDSTLQMPAVARKAPAKRRASAASYVLWAIIILGFVAVLTVDVIALLVFR